MTYTEFLKLCDIELFPGTTFTARELSAWGGWGAWNAQPFRDEGLCRNKTSNEYFRFTMHTEMRGNGPKLQFAIYTLGPSLGMDAP